MCLSILTRMREVGFGINECTEKPQVHVSMSVLSTDVSTVQYLRSVLSTDVSTVSTVQYLRSLLSTDVSTVSTVSTVQYLRNKY